MAIAKFIRSSATISPPIPALPAGCPNRPGWLVKPLGGGRSAILAHHGLRTIARDVRSDEARDIVRAINAHHELVDALRDCAGWLKSVGQVYKIPLVTEAAARARAVLDGVAS